jgi:hypothetical protein
MSPAATSVTWSYTWPAAGNGAVTIMSRAADDSGNLEKPGPGVSVTVNCPCGLFGQNYTPAVTSASDNAAYELGMKFQSNVAGWVAGVRFYKGTGNTGTHTGSLWSASGTQLATGTFTNETSSGWQSLLFANPVQISANTTYVVSYYDPAGHYADDQDLFDWALNTPPLTAPRAVYTTAGGGNGVFNAGGPGFPTSTYHGTSYGVDVIFAITQPPGAPPSALSATPVPGSSSNPVTTDPTVTLSKPVVPSTASFVLKDPNGTAVAGTTSFDSTNKIATFTPNSALAAGTTYTATMSGAQDQFGQPMTPYSFSFITSKAFTPGVCPCSVWPDVTPSGSTDASDTSQVELGVTVTPSADGTITGVRFYKEPDNTGTHTGTLWTSTGTQLATGTFSNESTTGWEELDFSSPVAVTAGTTYVAGYHTTTGHYALTPNNLASPVTTGPLTVPASGGVYTYGSSSSFPSSSYNGSNYWVDVVFQPKPDPNPPAASAVAPSNAATSVPVTSKVSVTFNKAIKPGSATFTLSGANQVAVPGSTSLDSSDTVLTFTPTSALSAGSSYTATVNGATSLQWGVTQTTAASWTFTTNGPAACPCTLFESDATPASSSANDSSSVELGVKFTADTNGWVSGVRFYKGAGNTGTHTGSLWSSSGTQLATGTFSGESASGWQTLLFANAVQITSGQTYVVSYHAPNGHYADDGGYFSSSGYDNSPLHAPQSAGVYVYGASQFPSNSYNGANYWVDPIFWTTQPADTPPAVNTTNPVNGQTSVPPNGAISATFSKAVQASTIQFALTGPGGVSVPGTLTYNSSTVTATFTPSASLSSATSYTATVSGAKDTAGTPMGAAYSWSFTTAQPTPPAGQCPCSIWPDATLPTVTSANDSSSVELGVRFTTDTSGWIKGIRFYKGAGNTGTHIGSLWDASGNLLGQVTFSGESAAGWEQANFSSSIAVTANTMYVASYLAPNGNYAADSGMFANAGVNSAPLHAPQTGANAGNGLYQYTNSPLFPTNSYNGTNYWVDVVFSTTP